jgi:predicted SnoaL-like aldol condensation-catalyzing enzyme
MRAPIIIITVVVALLACSSASNEEPEADVPTPGGPPTAGAGGSAPSSSGGQGSSGSGAAPVAGTAATADAGTSSGAGAGASGASGSAGAGGVDAAPNDAGTGVGTGGSAGSASQACDPALTTANRELVATAIDELFVDEDITAVDRHWADPYHQHNPIARSGVSTFRSIFSSIVSSPSFSYERLLTLADCDLVVVYGRYSQTGVIFDMFRVLDGKIMEHWDSDANQASEVGTLAPHDVDGPTAESRMLFAELSTTVLIGGATERAGELLADAYVEHHGSGGTGAASLTAFLEAESVTYQTVHHVIADGNYVFALSEGTRGSTAFGFYDLFRVEGGKLVEHWDSRRAVPSSTMSGLGIF